MAEIGNRDPRPDSVPFGNRNTRQGTAEQSAGPFGAGDRSGIGGSSRTAPSPRTTYSVQARIYSAVSALAIATYGLVEFLTRK